MNLSKIAQTYLGLISVFALVLVGSGVYIVQSGNASSSADSSLGASASPQFYISTDSPAINVGENTAIYLSGDFSNTPVNNVSMTVSYPANLIQIDSISTKGGILSRAKDSNINQKEGLITLVFSPLTASSGEGVFAKVNATSLKAGEGSINYSSLGVSSTKSEFQPNYTNTSLIVE